MLHRNQRCGVTSVLEIKYQALLFSLLSGFLSQFGATIWSHIMVVLRYVLFDGDVDALWVENMNSVMDDNKLLTLANGERMRLQKHCALLFEVRFSA